jgi:hypothetical protein
VITPACSSRFIRAETAGCERLIRRPISVTPRRPSACTMVKISWSSASNEAEVSVVIYFPFIGVRWPRSIIGAS